MLRSTSITRKTNTTTSSKLSFVRFLRPFKRFAERWFGCVRCFIWFFSFPFCLMTEFASKGVGTIQPINHPSGAIAVALQSHTTHHTDPMFIAPIWHDAGRAGMIPGFCWSVCSTSVTTPQSSRRDLTSGHLDFTIKLAWCQ